MSEAETQSTIEAPKLSQYLTAHTLLSLVGLLTMVYGFVSTYSELFVVGLAVHLVSCVPTHWVRPLVGRSRRVRQTISSRLATLHVPSRLTLAAVAAFVLGAAADLATTGVGLQLGLVESNPLGAVALGWAGVYGLVVFKAVVAVVVCGWTALLWRHYDHATILLYIPAGIGCLWSVAALWNALLLSGVVG